MPKFECPSPASKKSPAYSAICLTAFAEATERSILHGIPGKAASSSKPNTKLQSCISPMPSHLVSLPRSCQPRKMQEIFLFLKAPYPLSHTKRAGEKELPHKERTPLGI